ncbi:MAG: DUF2851 family protein [Chitinophagaceae bacterium]|nr:MAG: DUF2851 family protein [Chitinophagaceae bacterium]
MTERLFQFLWQFGYFSHNELRSAGGEFIQIVDRGRYNSNEGPDFLDARIRIGPALLAGSVELHLRTSDWDRHRHSGDPNYRNVILHVVFVHDRPTEERHLPVLELQPHVSTILLDRYAELLAQEGFIPCEKEALLVPDLVWTSWKDRLLAERMREKTGRIAALLQEARNDWEEVFWWLLARNFGMTVNTEAFEAVARSLPLPLLWRHRGSIHQLEALLLGQANLLHGRFSEDYPQLLQREYRYLQKLHPLQPVHRAVHFLRMRPPAFPTVRLAQLAALLKGEEHLFSRVLEAKELADVQQPFAVTANDYWHYHYRFEEESAFAPKKVGAVLLNSLLMNTLAPLVFAYGHLQARPELKERALGWLRTLPAEDNKVLRRFAAAGIRAEGAADGQALLYLEKTYCREKRCLDCAIGCALLKREWAPIVAKK